MFIEPALIGLAFAWIKNGRLRNIEKLHINAWYLFLLSALIQISLSLGQGLNLKFIENIIKNHFFILHLFTYILLILGVLFNINKTFMKFIFIGILLNAMVIFSNGGKMPVAINGLKDIDNYSQEIDRDFDIKHKNIDKNTRLPYLADIIIIPKPYPLARIISIGDIFIMLGVFVFFPENMIYKSRVKYFSQYLTKKQR